MPFRPAIRPFEHALPSIRSNLRELQFKINFRKVLDDLHTYDPHWDSEENVRGPPPGGHAATWRLYREVEEIMRKSAAEEAAALEAGVEADAEEAEDTDSDYDSDYDGPHATMMR